LNIILGLAGANFTFTDTGTGRVKPARDTLNKLAL
jgi:hypothetical protein